MLRTALGMIGGLVLGAGCNHISVPDCAATCTAEVGCPDGYSCQAGLCRVAGETGSCSEVMRMVSVVAAGSGRGSISSSPAGIACGAVCDHEFPVTGQVVLTATPDVGSTFTGWSGACSGTGTCMLAGTSDVAVAATFDRCDPQPGSRTFDVTGGPQTLALPACVSRITIDARGGAGARGAVTTTPVGTAGLGGRVVATIVVAAGDTFTVFVGDAASARTGGFNGGGRGGSRTTTSTQIGGGGGGASDVRRNGVALSDRIVVAGGGGGAAACGGTGWSGAAGGDLVGGAAVSTCVTFLALARGGSQTAGGTGGGFAGDSGGPACTADAGALGIGADACTESGGGGAGGGYYGGGGGVWHGGGGGSSFAIAGATSVTHTQGSETGAGQVIISW
jgi:hypothetical protein